MTIDLELEKKCSTLKTGMFLPVFLGSMIFRLILLLEDFAVWRSCSWQDLEISLRRDLVEHSLFIVGSDCGVEGLVDP